MNVPVTLFCFVFRKRAAGVSENIRQVRSMGGADENLTFSRSCPVRIATKKVLFFHSTLPAKMDCHLAGGLPAGGGKLPL